MKSLAYVVLLALSVSVFSCKSEKKKQTDQNYMIGTSKMDVKDYKGAIVAFYKCVKLNPNNYDAYHQLALAYKAQDDKKHALGCYHQAQRIMEKNEDLTQPEKRTEYQALLQEIKDYTTSLDNPAPAAPQNSPVTPDTTGN